MRRKRIPLTLNRNGHKVISAHLTTPHKLSQVAAACDRFSENPNATQRNEIEKQVYRELLGMGLVRYPGPWIQHTGDQP